VKGALYRRPNRVDPSGARIPKAWRLDSRRAGDLIATVDPGYRFSDPDSSSSPIPGNHGHGPTRHSVALVTGGSPLVRTRDIAPSRPGQVNPTNDTKILKEQSEQVDIGVTTAWLLGIREPSKQSKLGPQFQGRVLSEAFKARPSRACTKQKSAIETERTRGYETPRRSAVALLLGALGVAAVVRLRLERGSQRAAGRRGTSAS